MMVTCPPALHGRDRTRARLAALLDAALVGGGATVLLAGDPGLGKTALLDEVVEQAARAGMTVLRSRSVPGEGHVPFAALGQLLADVLDELDALPDAARIPLATALGFEAGPAPAPAAVAAGVVALLGLVAESSGGVLLALDDVHWMDDASLAATLFALRRVGREGVACVLAARPDPDRGLFDHGFEVLELEPLDAAAAARVVADAARERGGPALARIVALGRGNPLALREMTAALSDEQLAGATPLPEPLAPSLLIDRAFRRQLDRLDPAVREALVVLAAEEHELAPAAIAAAGLDPGTLDEAEAAGLVVADAAGLRFRHPLLRSVAYHAASRAQRRAAHRAWAGVEGHDPISRAWHGAATVTGPDEAVAAQLEAAAGLAEERGGLDAATDALARAAELTPGRQDRARRLLEAARYATGAARPHAAIGYADEGLRLAGDDPLLRANLHSARAFVLLRLGDIETAYTTIVEQAGRIAAQHPARAAAGLLTAAVRDRVVGDYPAMRALARRAADLAEGQDATVYGIARLTEAVVDVLQGDGDRGAALLEAHADALLRSDAAGHWVGEIVLAPAHALVWLGRFAIAERILEHRISRMRDLGEVPELLYPLTIRAQLHLRRGRVPAALADATEALQIAVESQQPGQVVVASGALAAVEAVLGRDEACRAHADEAIQLADDRSAMGQWARAALAVSLLGAGRPAEALPLLRECERAAARIGMGDPSVIAFGADLVEALVRTGARAEGRTALERWATAGTDTPWRRGAVGRCEGLLAEGDAAVAALEASVAAFEADGLHLEAARSRLCLGERLRRDRRRLHARPALQAALDAFERMGARPWADRARDELRATGQATADAAAAADGMDELTPHELRVALLVAGGRSNPEVAAELYVTRKTVEHHLSRVFRKLGVASRAELAGLLRERP